MQWNHIREKLDPRFLTSWLPQGQRSHSILIIKNQSMSINWTKLPRIAKRRNPDARWELINFQERQKGKINSGNNKKMLYCKIPVGTGSINGSRKKSHGIIRNETDLCFGELELRIFIHENWMKILILNSNSRNKPRIWENWAPREFRDGRAEEKTSISWIFRK